MKKARILATVATLGLSLLASSLHAAPEEKGKSCDEEECKTDRGREHRGDRYQGDRARDRSDNHDWHHAGHYDQRPNHAQQEKREAYFAGAKAALHVSVENGSMTKEEAETTLKKLMTYAQLMSPLSRGGAHKEKLYEAMGNGIRAAAELGKISNEDAKKMWEDVNNDRREAHLEEVMKRGLGAAVQLGKISKEDAAKMRGETGRDSAAESVPKVEKEISRTKPSSEKKVRPEEKRKAESRSARDRVDKPETGEK